VAIRDDVPPFQKWGSRTFTWGYLDRYYDSAAYLTQDGPGDRRHEFLARLDAALEGHKQVDLFLLAHRNEFISWVATLPAGRRSRLRLVYNTGCRDLGQGPRWLGLGARAYVGHPGLSASPVFYVFFLRRWARGYVLRDAVAEANGLMRAELARAGALSLGLLDAERVSRESEAFCHGDGGLRLGGEGE
jgi:hypothetical protein